MNSDLSSLSIDTESCKAWISGSPQRFFVVCRILNNSGNWIAKLVEKEPQGINPDILLLEIQAESHQEGEKSDFWVHYIQSRIPIEYEQVSIQIGRYEIPIEIDR